MLLADNERLRKEKEELKSKSSSKSSRKSRKPRSQKARKHKNVSYETKNSGINSGSDPELPEL